MNLRCHCGTTVVVEGNFVGDATKVGWNPIIGRDGMIHYVCPECLPSLKAAAKLIYDYSNEYASLGSLLKESTP